MQNTAAKQATEWFVKLSSGEVTDQEQHHWQAWRNQHPDNEVAWQQIASVSQTLKSAANTEVRNTLQRIYDQPASPNRRHALKQIGALAATGFVAYYTYQEKPWQPMLADYKVPTGGMQEARLADGTQLVMNTASVVNIDFNEHERLVTIVQGEVYIETGHHSSTHNPPFTVMTSHGKCIALGTRFSVRQYPHYTRVSVFDGAVKLIPQNHQANAITLNAGETTTFSEMQIAPPQAADPASIAWVKGFLIADEMSLADFTQELSRYRAGYLKCEPAIAQIKISGAFPINDPDQALQLLTSKFPIKVQTFTRYWANITAL